MSNNAGRLTPKERIASKDATAVASLRSAGAIPLLVSNTPELCQCWETYNKVTGRTNNPFDTRRTPGGSSGGEVNRHALINSYIFKMTCRWMHWKQMWACYGRICAGCIDEHVVQTETAVLWVDQCRVVTRVYELMFAFNYVVWSIWSIVLL